MSHTEQQNVTYYSGHEIEVNGKRVIIQGGIVVSEED